jgi:hypothetical protein
MEALELDTALEELEIRLERLRALYEQYFLGIEKIEPSVARKDVDRRIYVLRREKIRNTAKRFKLQTIIQRYNTFQQYWQRICRDIENGTYKRHLLRAERNFGGNLLTIAARKRLGHFSRSSRPPGAPASEPPKAGEPLAADAAPAAPSEAIAPEPAAARATPSSPAGRPRPAPAAAPQYESLDLDMDFLGDWDPSNVSPRDRRPPKGKSPPKAAPPPLTASRPEPDRPAAPEPAPAPPVAPVARAVPPPKPARPARSSPEAEVRPPPKPAKPASRPDAAPAPSLSEDRLRELHERLMEAKRQTNDSGSVSLQGLAKSLKATEDRLREKHKNRRIDFDIVIKDGKAVVKPTVR